MDDIKECDINLEFEDAQATAKKHSTTFKLPDVGYYENAVKPGDFVKICHMGERFWVRVIALLYEATGNKIAGLVANHLTEQTTLEYDDPVMFLYKNIYDLMDKKVADEEMADTEVDNVELVHSKCRGPTRDYH